MRFIVLTGLSGAGKTQALHALEDIGYYCVDNLPPLMLRQLAEMCLNATNPLDKVAVVTDIRGGAFLSGVGQALEDLRELEIPFDVLFLDAANDELIRRYSETRRAHPLGSDKLIIKAIERERKALEPLLISATRIIDTSSMLTRELRETMVRLYGDDENGPLKVTVLSFGFKRGMPQEADLMFDVRFLANPFYIPEMRPLTGLDAPVADYIHSFPETADFMGKTIDLLDFLLPLYVKEGKSRLVIAIGCTGGQHRSVLLAEDIAKALDGKGFDIAVEHRDKP